ncbi:MAG: macro domain-containing protein [Myxococcales bacterium]|nr:MAG: macro domain-containing protein [Myxococcales bacterium]
MITEVSGDILLSSANAIVHGIAPFDHFNQGLALALRERWPSLYKDFRHYCTNFHPKCGELWSWGGPEQVRIISLFTQDPPLSEHQKPGKARIENVHQCLRALKKEVEKEKYKSIAIPRLACGVGGLSWDEVKPTIQRDLAELNAEVHVYGQYVAQKEAAISA